MLLRISFNNEFLPSVVSYLIYKSLLIRNSLLMSGYAVDLCWHPPPQLWVSSSLWFDPPVVRTHPQRFDSSFLSVMWDKVPLHRALCVCTYSVMLVELLTDLMFFFPSWIKKQRRAGNYQELYVVCFFLTFLAFPRWPNIPTLLDVRPYSSHAWRTWGLLVFPQHLLLKCSNIQKSWKNFTVNSGILTIPIIPLAFTKPAVSHRFLKDLPFPF